MVPKIRYWRLMGKSFAAVGRMMLRHEVPRDAAGISYFTLLALFPAFLITIALSDSIMGKSDFHQPIVESITNLFPGSREYILSSLSEITSPSRTVLISCIVVVFWSSSWIFTFIESSINRAWDMPNQRTFWESRLRTFALMALGGISLLSSAAITAFVNTTKDQTAAYIGVSAQASFLRLFGNVILLGVGMVIAILVLASIFKWTPHCKVFWKEAFSGALVSVIMWEIGSYIFYNVVPIFNYEQVYGRMGVVITLLAWVYTSNLILLFGANFSAQFHWVAMDMVDSDTLPPA